MTFKKIQASTSRLSDGRRSAVAVQRCCVTVIIGG